MYYEKKVFVTGVYGVGKTYYAQNVVPKICSREYIDFDKNFSYKTQSLDEIHRKMNEYDKFVIDAIPCLTGWGRVKANAQTSTREHESFDWLQKFSAKNLCTVILVKCNLKTWLDRAQVRGKKKRDKENIKSYNLFYEGGGFVEMIRPFGEKVDLVVYNSDTGEHEPRH